MGTCNCISGNEENNEINNDEKRAEKLKNNRIKYSLKKNDIEIDEKENQIQFTGIENGLEIKETGGMLEIKNIESERSEKQSEKKNYNSNIITKTRPKKFLDGNNTNRTNETIFQFDTNRNMPFPVGEHRFQIVKDFNQIKIEEKKDNLSERVELFFSLKYIEEP